MKVGVVGFGYWGPHLVRNFRLIPAVEEVIVCDQSEERLNVAKSLYPGISCYLRISEMLQANEIDAIAIATPSHTHYELVQESLSKGLHVLVEKPITTDSLRAGDLVRMARDAGLVLMVDHTYLYSDAIKYMKKAADDGRIGRIRSIDSVRVNLGIFQPDVSVVWDLAIHDLAIICHILGSFPAKVSATGSRHASSKYLSTSYITLFFEGGVVAHIHVSWTSPVKVRRLMVEGELGSFVFDDTLHDEKVKIYDAQVDSTTIDDGTSLLLNYRLGDVTAPRLNGNETLRVELLDFVDCVNTKRDPVSSGVSAVPLIRVLEAIDKSIELNGSSVTVSEIQS